MSEMDTSIKTITRRSYDENMHYLRTLFLLVSSLCFTLAAHAGVTLKLEVLTHHEPSAGSKNAPTDSSAAMDVVLANQSMQLRSAKETGFFDFGKRRRIVVDNSTKTQVNYSLFDAVGFRLYELKNRAMLGKALAAAKIDQAAMSVVDSEHILSIQEKPSSPLQIKTEGQDEIFLNGSVEFFRRSIQATPVTPNDAKMFAQVFRYAFGGHPQILQALAQSNAIASQLVLTTYDATGITTRKIFVKSVTPSNDAALQAPTFPKRAASAATDPIDKLLDQTDAVTPAELATARQRNQNERQTAWNEDRALDAYLGSVEWSLMTGEALPAFTAEQKTRLQSEPAIAQLGKALNARTKDDLSAAVKVFEQVRSTGLQKAYIVKIFEANDRAMLGDPPTARKLFLEVLDTNPFIAGVYKDLGDVQFQGFDMPRAWRCWDLGRRIAPQFRNFEPVNQFEQTLGADHPEFF